MAATATRHYWALETWLLQTEMCCKRKLHTGLEVKFLAPILY